MKEIDERLVDTEELVVNMSDLIDGDLVLGTDGCWHEIKILPIEDKPLYKVILNVGDVVCSYDHYWVVFDKELGRIELSTVEIYGEIEKRVGSIVGAEDSGVCIKDVVQYGYGKCRCIEVQDSEDHQFEIFTDKGEKVFTRNCQVRMSCGRLDTTASLMCHDSSIATTTDGNHKGAGVYQVNGQSTSVQFYYEEPEWLDKWYENHGFDVKGFPIGESLEEETISLGEDEEEFSISDNDQHFEFEKEAKDIINRKEQKFENV